MDGKVPKLLSRDFSASARIAVHLKDINNAMDVAAHLGVELPMTEIVKEQMDWMDARGMIDRIAANNWRTPYGIDPKSFRPEA